MIFLKKCFDCQLKVHIYLYKRLYIIKEIINYLNIIMAIFIFLIAFTRSIFLTYCFLFISCIYLLINGLSIINTTFTSLRGFLKYGFFIEFFLSFSIMFASREILEVSLQNINSTMDTMIIIFSTLITWLILSLIVNNEVAKITNLILATFFGILVYFKDLIILCLPDRDIEPYMMYGLSYTYKQVGEIILSIILTPFLITNILATLLCEIKGYWINKYNDGIDISIELIKKEIEKNNY